jgi:hypothetical protein
MDPYLEAPDLWPDFHDSFLSYTREALQPLLPGPYYAKLNTRDEVGIAGERPGRVIIPDVSVQRAESGRVAGRSSSSFSAGAAVATLPESLVVAEDEMLRVNFLEIRDHARGDELITLIELLSPGNKVKGPDREAFLAKQKETLSSSTNWVALDFLRRGRRIACHPSVEAHCEWKGYEYVVAVSRASRRLRGLEVDIYGFTVRDPFPVCAVPLREPDPDVTLDLGRVFDRVCDTGPYTKIVDYTQPPEPPLRRDDADWARELCAPRT